MDTPVQLWVVGLVLIFICLIAMIGIQHEIPMFVRGNFDDICNSYLAVIEKEGGLSTTKKAQLKVALSNLDINNVNITAPNNGKWGDRVTLIVEGEYRFEVTNPTTLTKEIKMKNIRYENSTINLCND